MKPLYTFLLIVFCLPLLSQDCQDISQVRIPPLCPAVIDWVCGCDSVTYENPCFAEQQGGVTSYYSGKCDQPCVDPDSIDMNVMCPAVYDPVCGCNGVTYVNACEARYYNGVLIFEDGECPSGCIDTAQIDSGTVCQTVYDPVCGCDSITYQNNCIAEFYAGVAVYSPGPCPLTYCKDFTTIDSSFNCLDVLDPVCGCDGITYNNACEAEKYNGVQRWTQGSCETALNDRLADDVLSIYPIPTYRSLTIALQLPAIKQGHLVLTDLAGKTLITRPFSQPVNTMDVSPLQQGYYLLKVTVDGKTAVRKVLVLE